MDYYDLCANVWIDEEGRIVYYVAQSFDPEDTDREILAHGEATDWPDAMKQVFQAISEVSH